MMHWFRKAPPPLPCCRRSRSSAASVALMHFIGLYVASALYIGFYMRWVGRHSWLSVTLPVGIPVVTFLVFEKWFLVPMPKGPLEQWLGY